MLLRSITLSCCMIPFTASALSEAVSGYPDAMTGKIMSMTVDQTMVQRYLSSRINTLQPALNKTEPASEQGIRIELPSLQGFTMEHVCAEGHLPVSRLHYEPRRSDDLPGDHSLARISQYFPNDLQLSFIYNSELNSLSVVSSERTLDIKLSGLRASSENLPAILEPDIGQLVLSALECMDHHSQNIDRVAECPGGVLYNNGYGRFTYSSPDSKESTSPPLLASSNGATLQALTSTEHYITYRDENGIVSATVCPSDAVSWQDSVPQCLIPGTQEPYDMGGQEKQSKDGGHQDSKDKAAPPPAAANLTPNQIRYSGTSDSSGDDSDDEDPQRPVSYSQGQREHYKERDFDEWDYDGWDCDGWDCEDHKSRSIFDGYISEDDNIKDRYDVDELQQGTKGRVRHRKKRDHDLLRSARGGRMFQANIVGQRQRDPGSHRQHRNNELPGGNPRGRGGRGNYQQPNDHDGRPNAESGVKNHRQQQQSFAPTPPKQTVTASNPTFQQDQGISAQR